MTTLLIDGDILLYQAANSVEKVFDWGDDLWSIAADLKEAKGIYLKKIAELQLSAGDADYISCISDPSGTFRHGLYDDYKGNRKGRKPLVLKSLREWAIQEGGMVFPDLEADDTMGILATSGTISDPVIVTIDKDLRSVPGRHYNQDKPDEGIVRVTKEEGRRFHLVQTIAGDSTDNIKGVPDIGMVRAERLLEKEGYSWETVLDAYKSKDLTEEDALLNARLTKILTVDEWDFEKQEIVHWLPGVMA